MACGALAKGELELVELRCVRLGHPFELGLGPRQRALGAIGPQAELLDLRGRRGARLGGGAHLLDLGR